MTNDHILLTGGTGFFGKALLRYWAALESKGQDIATVTLLSRDPARFAAQYPALVSHRWLHLAQGDVCNPDSLPKGLTFTHVLHAATDSTAGPQLTPLQRFDQIVSGTRNILDLAVATGASRFLLTSSGGVYGPQPLHMEQIPEDYLGMTDPLNPSNAYSVAKRCVEHLGAIYRQQYGLETVIARCFAFVGKDLPRDVHFAIGNFIRDALERTEITVAGDGTSIRSYLDQRDLAEWLSALLERGESGRAYNVGSDEAINVGDLAHLVRDVLSPGKTVRILGKPEDSKSSSQHRNVYVPSIKRAREELGLKVCVPLRDAIREAAGLQGGLRTTIVEVSQR
jgi:UDP-glucuronate decarboxylase